ncbi:hypothetical protein, partial [Vibrio campbellii]|uniref:hypothetical protein n=1 Tax=Vibrio campbellii TaxID=680 RepID=UPI001E2995DC
FVRPPKYFGEKLFVVIHCALFRPEVKSITPIELIGRSDNKIAGMHSSHEAHRKRLDLNYSLENFNPLA